MSEEATMRAIDCACGHQVEAAERQRSDEHIRERITADAYEAATV